MVGCSRAPKGWVCIRGPHTGPCAAYKDDPYEVVTARVSPVLRSALNGLRGAVYTQQTKGAVYAFLDATDAYIIMEFLESLFPRDKSGLKELAELDQEEVSHSLGLHVYSYRCPTCTGH